MISTQRDLRARLDGGDTLAFEHVTEGRSRFYMLSDGATVANQIARRLIARGLVVPGADSLFNESQTYRLVEK